MLSAESQVDVMLGLWKNIGLTNTEVSSSVRSLSSYTVGECVSATGPQDTFDGSAQGKFPCEDDINKGLVDGRAEGRIGVQEESACDMLC